MTIHNFDWNSGRIWLYSGLISGWWCYSSSNNTKINIMHMDYCKRNALTYQKVPTKMNMGDPEKKNNNLIKIYDFVDFDRNVNVNANQNITLTDYIIYASNGSFRIDMSKMKQINMSNPCEHRNIKYIDIPEMLLGNADQIIAHLKNNNIKGISGKKFD